MIDINKHLTVFLITSGNNPNYEYCLKALNHQTITFKLEIIKNYYPMSKAFQEMLNRCKTKYYIEVDEDMILDPNAIELLYNSIEKSNNTISMITYKLHDIHINFDIYGIKIYKYDIFKNYPYNLKHPSCEMEQIERMKKDNYTYLTIEKVIGKHSPYWTNELIFERYYNLMEKFKLYGYSWLANIPDKLQNLLKENPTEQNFYALMGASLSILSNQNIEREKNTNIKNENYYKIKSYLEKPTFATIYMTNKCNFKCDWCYRQHHLIESSIDADSRLVNTLIEKFPSIMGICVCFTGDTKIKLVNGTTKTFKELTEKWNENKKSFEVYSRNKNNNIIRGTARHPRITRQIKKIIKLTLDNNKIIKCTPEHLFMLKNGTYKQAINLKKTDSLMSLYTTYKPLGKSNFEKVKKEATYNHKIIKKEIINLKTSIDVYCMTVNKYHNFALESGVFVKNCGFGEPLLSPNLKWVLQTLKKTKRTIGLITNGSLLKKRIKELSQPNVSPNYISVSLNAHNQILHQKITKTNTWNDVIEGIKIAVEYPIPLYVTYVTTTENMQYVPEFLKLVKSLKVKTVYLHNVLPHFDKKENKSFWDLVMTKKHYHIIEEWKKLPESNIVQKYPILIEKDNCPMHCQFPWKMIGVNGNGDISICNSVFPCSSRFGNLYKNTAGKSLYSFEFRKKFINKEIDACQKCFRNWEQV